MSVRLGIVMDPIAQIAFKKDQTLAPNTAQSLARLIERAEEQFKAQVRDVAGH